MHKFIIFTIGRTGSHIIYNYFIRHGFTGIHFSLNHEEKKSDLQALIREDKIIVHSHKHDINIVDPENWNVIISTRKDLFDQYCSFRIAQETNQYTEYLEIKKIQKLKIDLKHVLARTKLYYEYPKIIQNKVLKNKKFKRIIEIAYEDLVDNHRYLFDKIPLNIPIVDKIKDFSYKSPYDFEEYIDDYNNQKSLFLKKSVFTNRPI